MKHSTLVSALIERPMGIALPFAIAPLLGFLPANAGPNTAQQLPFHAVFQGNANPRSTGPCTLENQETGAGTALHLGEWTWSDNEAVQFLSCPPGAAITVSGQFKMVAASGDIIDGTFETTGTFDPATGVSVQGPYTFTSGTGRFAHVSGIGVIAAHGSAGPPFDFVASMDGTISNIGQ